jgi:probable HAF family extracellular repeat protein
LEKTLTAKMGAQMKIISKLLAVALLGSAILLTGCDPSGLSGTDQTVEEMKPSSVMNSNQLNTAATEYEFVKLGTLGQSSAFALDINESGKVVGYGPTLYSRVRGFTWTDVEGFKILNTLNDTESQAKAINNYGITVGESTNVNGDRQASLWDESGDMVFLGSSGSSGSFSTANGINNNGEVIGFRRTNIGEPRAFIWDEGRDMRDLGTLGGSSSLAYSINENAQVVGQSVTSSEERHAFIWDEDRGIRDLGTLGGSLSLAYDINDNGQVVGLSRTSNGEPHAFIWDEGRGMRDLGTLGGRYSSAEGINNNGQVVGLSQTSTGEMRAFIWDEYGGIRELGTPGREFSMAYGINDIGQVVGYIRTSNGITNASLWNPIRNSDTSPPVISYETVSTNLWPPNHKMHLVLSGISATDDSDEDPSLSVSVTSSEMRNGLGDGNTDEDWQIVQANDGSYEVYIRAERSGKGSGRTYTVTMKAEDASGNVAEEIVDVQVARDKGRAFN